MSRYITIFILSILSFSACKKKQEDIMADIRKNYAKINEKLSDYTHKQVDDITSPGGGSINGYYRDEEVKKISAQHYADTNRVFTDYYFDDGMLILVVEQKFVYNMSNKKTEEEALKAGDSVWYDDKKTKLEQSRFYFHKNKLIKWIDAYNSDVAINNIQFINKESEHWANAVILIKELKEQ